MTHAQGGCTCSDHATAQGSVALAPCSVCVYMGGSSSSLSVLHFSHTSLIWGAQSAHTVHCREHCWCSLQGLQFGSCAFLDLQGVPKLCALHVLPGVPAIVQGARVLQARGDGLQWLSLDVDAGRLVACCGGIALAASCAWCVGFRKAGELLGGGCPS